MRTPEGKWKDKVHALLDAHGAYQFWPVPTGYGKRTLDCLGCHYGQFFAVETKRGGKDLTPYQKNTAEEIQEACGRVFRVNSDPTLLELERWLTRIRDAALWTSGAST